MRHYATQFNSIPPDRLDDCLGQISSPSDLRRSPLIPAHYNTRPLRSDRAAGLNGCVVRRCAVVARRNAGAASCSQVVVPNIDAVVRRDGVVIRIDKADFPGVSGGCSEHRHRCTEGRVCRGERRRRRPHRRCRGSGGGMPYLRTTMEQSGTTILQFRTTMLQFGTTTACFGGTAELFAGTGARRRACRVRLCASIPERRQAGAPTVHSLAGLLARRRPLKRVAMVSLSASSPTPLPMALASA